MFTFGNRVDSPRNHRKSSERERQALRKALATRLRFEPLEERRLLSVYTVTNLLDSGAGSLRFFINEANQEGEDFKTADTIVFDSSLSGGTITLTSGELLITDNLKIEGLGAANLTISGGNSSRIFNIDDGDEETNLRITIQDITLTEGATTGNGGAIFSGENLTLDNVTITDNTAASGGGIWLYPSRGADVTIENSIISGNTANGSGGGIGGYTSYGTETTITNCTISGNHANGGDTIGNGGGIQLDVFYGATITIQNSAISEENTANGSGGGVALDVSDSSTATIQSSTITGNTSHGSGGGIWLQSEYSSTTTIEGNTISDNFALGSGDGGGIWAYTTDSSKTTIQSNTISGNSANGSGGGIATETSGTATETSAYAKTTIDSNTISANTSGTNGGGLWAYSGEDGITVIQNCRIFDKNSAGNEGGGIMATAAALGRMTILTSTIDGNTASFGGGVALVADADAFDAVGFVRLESSTISDNTATLDGGGVWLNTAQYALTIVQNSTISGNTAAGCGGGLYTQNYSSTMVLNSTITGNKAYTGGGVFAYADDDDANEVTIQSTIIAVNSDTSNTAPDLTGAVDPYYCLIGNNTGSGLAAAPVSSPSAQNNIIGSSSGAGVIDPKLGPLADNGGPTWTHALLTGSPAIGRGNNQANLSYDQRGSGYPRKRTGNIVDIGAYELAASEIADQEIAVFDGDTELTDGQTTAINFGTVAHGGASITRTFTITNTGDETLTLTASSFLSTTHFSVVAPSDLSLDAGESTTFTVTLRTTAVWSGSETISFTNNDADESPFTFVVSGAVTATPAEITVKNGSTVITSGQTAPIDLGSVQIGASGTSITLTIINEGDAALTLNASSFVSTAHFTVSQPGKTSLATGETTTFTVTLITTDAWSGSEQISFTNNDGNESPFTFVVSGIVISEPAELTVLNGSTILIDGQTTPIALASRQVGQDGSSLTITIRNDGDESLTLDATSFVDTTHFTVSQPGKTTLASQESTTFTITLKTTAVWSGSEQISFTSNDSDESPFTFVVSGVVIASVPDVTVLNGTTNVVDGQTTPINLGSVIWNAAGPSVTFTIRNDGNSTLTLDAASFVDATYFAVSQPGATTLAAGGSTTFTVTLKTDVLWSGSEQISFTSNDPDESPFTFLVSGSVSAIGPEITVLDGTDVIADGQTSSINVGTSPHNATGASKTFTIRNDGDATLTLDAATFVGTTHFAVSQPGATYLAPGESTTFTVTLLTDSVWTGSESISFNCNDPTDGESTFAFPVSGSVTKVAAEITVLIDSTVIVDGQTIPIDLGSVARGSEDVSITVTIRNDGDTTLRLATPFASTEHFTVSRPKRTSLSAGASTTFTITLNTDAVWTGSEQIVFYNNDADGGDGIESPFEFFVSGTVTPMPQEITVLDEDNESIDSGKTTAIKIGTTTHNGTVVSKTFTIRNDGDETLVLDAASFVDTDHFTVSQPGKTSLAAGETTTFTVTLKTDVVWSGSEYISFASNDGDNGDGVESPFTIRVSGTVRTGLPEISVSYGSSILTDGQSTAISAGSSVYSTAGNTIAVTIRNDGERTLTLRSSSFESTTHFAVGKPDDLTLRAGESTTFTITLKTAEVWSGSETISFLCNDGDNGDGVESPFTFAVSGQITAPLYDITTIGQYDASKGVFYLENMNGSGTADTSFIYGAAKSGWIAISGDWNGDGVDTVGLYDPATSTFYLKNTNSTGYADVAFAYGRAGWTPIVGDWNGDGVDTIGLYDPAVSTFYLKNANSTGYADVAFAYGQAGAGWTPIVGDWNGDHIDTVGLYNPDASTFYLRNANYTGYADVAFAYGPAGDGWLPIAGDWDGDGRDTIGLFNAKKSTFYLKYANTAGYSDATFSLDAPKRVCTPVVGVWSTGSPLAAAGGQSADASDAASLTEAELQPIVSEAIARWSAAGIDDAALAVLSQVEFVITNLSGSLLGYADRNVIQLDVDAAGYGWFVDPTPARDEEFAAVSDAQLQAIDAQAVDHIDLLSVVEHELGHVLGFDDLDAMAQDVMSGVLGVGIRRLA